MKKLGLNDIREEYFKFFEQRGHLRLKSASLIPQNDKSLLLIVAGMAPLKPYFTGQETPPATRIVSCQKCIRTNDIENVGITSRHGTFFEMLGNFSFGDYFKDEIIPWAWEFLTECLEIQPEVLYPSVYIEDDETYGIWRDKVGIPEERIVRLGKSDNFWEHGAGPCGPCSEIYFDRGSERGCGSPECQPGCDCDRFVEIWNLVFTQFNKEEDGSYSKLEKRNIDTGMGLERIAIVLQGVSSLFDVDTFKTIREKVCVVSGVSYGSSQKTDLSVKIISDHVRAVTFMLSDGILPSNEGRGYILRRLLRRASRHGRLLGINRLFISEIAVSVISVMECAYPELREKEGYILKQIDMEEKRFRETLDQGIEAFRKRVTANKTQMTPVMLGQEAFLLYDTFGFPFELTMEMLQEEGMRSEEEIISGAFSDEMNKQRTRARQARGESSLMGSGDLAITRLPSGMSTDFWGYNNNIISGVKILAIISDGETIAEASAGQEIALIPDKTPLYAEGGGQKGDSGVIKTESGVMEVTDCQKAGGNKSVHYGKVISGYIKGGQTAEIALDPVRRTSLARNHTATHLLHKTLRDMLGNHAEQAGSLVSEDRLRFDFTHFSPLAEDEIRKLEDTVNEQVISGAEVTITETTPEKAREMGAAALFGEKYGTSVRVVDIGGYSLELCGGTHLDNAAKIGLFKIISETGVAAGIRRIEAVTGANAIAYYRDLENTMRDASRLVKSTPENLITKISALIAEKNMLQTETAKLKSQSNAGIADELYQNREMINGISVIAAQTDNLGTDESRELADKLRDKLNPVPGLALIYCRNDGKSSLLASATDGGIKAGVHCGNIVKETAKFFGGGGGGRPNMAMAGIPETADPNAVLNKAKETAANQCVKY